MILNASNLSAQVAAYGSVASALVAAATLVFATFTYLRVRKVDELNSVRQAVIDIPSTYSKIDAKLSLPAFYRVAQRIADKVCSVMEAPSNDAFKDFLKDVERTEVLKQAFLLGAEKANVRQEYGELEDDFSKSILSLSKRFPSLALVIDSAFRYTAQASNQALGARVGLQIIDIPGGDQGKMLDLIDRLCAEGVTYRSALTEVIVLAPYSAMRNNGQVIVDKVEELIKKLLGNLSDLSDSQLSKMSNTDIRGFASVERSAFDQIDLLIAAYSDVLQPNYAVQDFTDIVTIRAQLGQLTN